MLFFFYEMRFFLLVFNLDPFDSSAHERSIGFGGVVVASPKKVGDGRARPSVSLLAALISIRTIIFCSSFSFFLFD